MWAKGVAYPNLIRARFIGVFPSCNALTRWPSFFQEDRDIGLTQGDLIGMASDTTRSEDGQPVNSCIRCVKTRIYKLARKYTLGTRSVIKSTKSNCYPCLPLATAYCGEAGRRNPIWSSVDPHAEHAVVNGGMVYLLLFSDTLPVAINSIEPDVVYVGHPVMVNIELADFWGYFRRRRRDVMRRRRGIP